MHITLCNIYYGFSYLFCCYVNRLIDFTLFMPMYLGLSMHIYRKWRPSALSIVSKYVGTYINPDKFV